MSTIEKTLIIIKPDAVSRCLCGKIISRFEAKGLGIVGLKLMRIPRKLATSHYAEHKDKPFYKGLLDFITSGPVVVLALAGIDAIRVCRKLTGATCGREAQPGTIRGDFGMSNRYNLIHASDSTKSAKRELSLYFSKQEMITFSSKNLHLVYDNSGSEPI